jgi:putative transposase
VACQAQGQPRRSFPAGKRGPQTPHSDAALLGLIRADLNPSPFQGEGRRKVGGRLGVRDGVKVGRRRVLRLRRENHLLSPDGGRRGNPRLHPGEIIPPAPNRMGGTDGASVFTVEEGRIWIFVAVEHGNAEGVEGAGLQTGDPMCGPGAHFPGAEVNRRIGGGRPRPVPIPGGDHAPSIC